MSCAVRNLAVFGVVLWTDVQPLTMCSTELSAGARAAMFLFHQLACPGLILIVYYQLSSWLKERNKIVERLDALAERRLVRSKQLTLSLETILFGTFFLSKRTFQETWIGKKRSPNTSSPDSVKSSNAYGTSKPR